MSKIKTIVKTRDMNIYLTATKEINLGTRSIKSKKVYSRSIKHKNKKFDYDKTLTECFIIVNSCL